MPRYSLTLAMSLFNLSLLNSTITPSSSDYAPGALGNSFYFDQLLALSCRQWQSSVQNG